MKRGILFTLLILPFFAHAQSLQTFLTNLMAFINKTVIPFLLGIAFLIFVINAVRYFIIQGANDDGREKAKNLAIYGVFAFVLLIVFWGIVNLLAQSIGLENETAPTPDYLEINDTELNSPSPARNNNGGDGGNRSNDPIGDIIRTGG